MLGATILCLAALAEPAAAFGNNKLATGKIRLDDYLITDQAGNPVAIKRITVLWRYSDTDKDGEFIWGGLPLIGDDLRLVFRTEYWFTADFVADPQWNGQLTTFHLGPLDPVTNTYLPSVFRGVRHDDFLPGLPVPGDFVVTQGEDGLPVPGLSANAHIFTDQGDWDPNLGPTPLIAPRWGIRYVLDFAPGVPRVIPNGTYMFLDSQLDMQNLAPGTCENGWSEEEWLTTGGLQGFTQPGPSTADPASFITFDGLESPPILFLPVGHPCDTQG